MRNVTIIGAGLAGSMLAIYLAKRGYDIVVFESRPDLRRKKIDFGRSINLALSKRGITSLAEIGLLDKVHEIAVPMRARAIHENDGSKKYQAFGRHHDEYINAISRSELNRLLLEQLAQFPQVHINFGSKITAIDFHRKQFSFVTNEGNPGEAYFSHLIGADGAGSIVRNELAREGLIDFSKELLPHSYKELAIPCQFGRTMEAEHLHLWPRDSFMLLGNPNIDNSITISLFLANEGNPSFANLKNKAQVSQFFQDYFPDAYDKMPTLLSDFFKNPTGQMGTIKCDPWHHADNVLLIGDAAHGIVPFFGQGMNCAFEDCRIFNQLLDDNNEDWAAVFEKFYQLRKPNTIAVAAMSMDNYREIQVDVRHPQFIMRKALEQELMHRYPDQYISKHILVMFTTTPYAQAYRIGELQQAMLHRLCDPLTSLEQLDWLVVERELREYNRGLAELRLKET